jgi:small membrane protein
MIKVIVSLALVCFFGYGFVNRTKILGLALSVYALTGAGLYFVWFPNQTTAIAHLVGVGRGTDLLLYCWLLASLMVMFNLHLKSIEQLRMLTDLARALTLATAPADPSSGKTDQVGLSGIGS